MKIYFYSNVDNVMRATTVGRHFHRAVVTCSNLDVIDLRFCSMVSCKAGHNQLSMLLNDISAIENVCCD